MITFLDRYALMYVLEIKDTYQIFHEIKIVITLNISGELFYLVFDPLNCF